jgi:hypothetical protein
MGTFRYSLYALSALLVTASAFAQRAERAGKVAEASEAPREREAVEPQAEASKTRRPLGEPRKADSQHARRERWRQLSPEKQAELRARFEQLNSLDEGQRKDVEERASRLRHMAEGVIKGLSAAERKRLEALEPEQRGKILRAMVEQAARQHGQRVHGKLPPEVRERLAAAAPEERGPILAELRQRSREHESASAIERLGRHLDLDRAEVERLKALSPEERMQKVMELGRHAIQLRMEGGYAGQPGPEGSGPGGHPTGHGEPGAHREPRFPGGHGLDRETWQRIRQLPPEEFHAALQRMGHSLKGSGAPPPTWASDLNPEQLDRLRRVIREYGRHSAGDWIEVAELPEHERPRELGRRARARAIKHIKEQGLLSADRIEQLRAMPERQFADAVRRLMQGGGERSTRAPKHQAGRTPGKPGQGPPSPGAGRSGQGKPQRARRPAGSQRPEGTAPHAAGSNGKAPRQAGEQPPARPDKPRKDEHQ